MSFTYTPAVPKVNETITFTNGASGTSYLWDFGDGSTATTQSTTHAYSDIGVYDVSLTTSTPDITASNILHFDIPNGYIVDACPTGLIGTIFPGAGPTTSVITTSNPLFGSASMRIGNLGGGIFPNSASLGASAQWTFDFSTYSLSGDDTTYSISFDFYDSSSVRFRQTDTDAIITLSSNGEYSFTVPANLNEWIRWAFTMDFDTGAFGCWMNGIKIGDGNFVSLSGATDAYITPGNGSFKTSVLYLDEIRVVKGIAYTGDYTLTTAAFNITEPGQSIVETQQVTVPGIGSNQNTLFLPLKKLNDEQYASIRVRGLNNQWPTVFFDNGGYPNREIFVWPIPQSVQAVELWLWEPLEIYDLDQELNLPPGYERYLRFKLAMELAAEFGKEVSPEIVQIANEAEKNLKSLNQQVPISKTSKVFSRKPATNYIDFITSSSTLPNWD